MSLESHNQTKVLTLDKPVPATLRPIRRGIRHQHKRLAESSLWLISAIAISHMPADDDKDRHVFDGHLVRGLDAGSGHGWVGAIDDLAVI